MVVSSIQTLHFCNVQSRSVYLDIPILLRCCTIDSLTILAVFELIYVGAASVALNLISFDKIPTFIQLLAHKEKCSSFFLSFHSFFVQPRIKFERKTRRRE